MLRGFFNWLFDGCAHTWKTTDSRDFSLNYYLRVCTKCGKIKLFEK